MPVTGLVIVLDPPRGQAALRSIGRNRAITLGSGGTPQRVPAVLETKDHDQSARELKWLEEQAGVAMVEVISVDFSDLDASNTPHRRASQTTTADQEGNPSP